MVMLESWDVCVVRGSTVCAKELLDIIRMSKLGTTDYMIKMSFFLFCAVCLTVNLRNRLTENDILFQRWRWRKFQRIRLVDLDVSVDNVPVTIHING
jgi:hypothetical protein